MTARALAALKALVADFDKSVITKDPMLVEARAAITEAEGVIDAPVACVPWRVHILKDGGVWHYQIRANDDVLGRVNGPYGRHIATVNSHLRDVEEVASTLAAAQDMRAGLEQIANEPCDHGAGPFCPRGLARDILAKIKG